MEALFSLEVVIDKLYIPGITCRIPSILCKLLDFPALTINLIDDRSIERIKQTLKADPSWIIPAQFHWLKDIEDTFVFKRGKSCLFKMAPENLLYHLSSVPLYMLVLDILPDTSKLLGNVSLLLDTAVKQVCSQVEQDRFSCPKVFENKGTLRIYSLMGKDMGYMTVGYRLLYLGFNPLSHIIGMTDGCEESKEDAISYTYDSVSRDEGHIDKCKPVNTKNEGSNTNCVESGFSTITNHVENNIVTIRRSVETQANMRRPSQLYSTDTDDGDTTQESEQEELSEQEIEFRSQVSKKVNIYLYEPPNVENLIENEEHIVGRTELSEDEHYFEDYAPPTMVYHNDGYPSCHIPVPTHEELHQLYMKEADGEFEIVPREYMVHNKEEDKLEVIESPSHLPVKHSGKHAAHLTGGEFPFLTGLLKELNSIDMPTLMNQINHIKHESQIPSKHYSTEGTQTINKKYTKVHNKRQLKPDSRSKHRNWIQTTTAKSMLQYGLTKSYTLRLEQTQLQKEAEKKTLGLISQRNLAKINRSLRKWTGRKSERLNGGSGRQKEISKEIGSQVRAWETPVKEGQTQRRRGKHSIRAEEALGKKAKPPVKRREAPQGVETPVKRRETPARRVQSPVETPTRRVERPMKEVESPVKEVESPVKEVESPVKGVRTPVKGWEAPMRKVESPVQRAESPMKRVESPMRRVESPVQRVESPRQRVESPMQRLESPVNGVESAMDRVESPNKGWESLVRQIEIKEKTLKEHNMSVDRNRVNEMEAEKGEAAVQTDDSSIIEEGERKSVSSTLSGKERKPVKLSHRNADEVEDDYYSSDFDSSASQEEIFSSDITSSSRKSSKVNDGDAYKYSSDFDGSDIRENEQYSDVVICRISNIDEEDVTSLYSEAESSVSSGKRLKEESGSDVYFVSSNRKYKSDKTTSPIKRTASENTSPEINRISRFDKTKSPNYKRGNNNNSVDSNTSDVSVPTGRRSLRKNLPMLSRDSVNTDSVSSYKPSDENILEQTSGASGDQGGVDFSDNFSLPSADDEKGKSKAFPKQQKKILRSENKLGYTIW